VELTVGKGRKLIIEAKRQSASSIYIQSVAWNGIAVKGLSVEHAKLVEGGRLTFHLGDAPSV